MGGSASNPSSSEVDKGQGLLDYVKPVSNSTEQKPVAQSQPWYLSVDECNRKRGVYAQHSFIQLYRKMKLDCLQAFG